MEDMVMTAAAMEVTGTAALELDLDLAGLR
jgi:hypothetical protein